MKKLLRSIKKRIFFAQHLRHAIEYFKSIKSLDESVNHLYDLVLGYSGQGYFQSLDLKQSRQEIIEFMQFLDERDLSNIMEIGTHKGGTLFLWSKLLRERTGSVISLDLPGGDFGGGLARGAEGLFESFVNENQTMHVLRMNSHCRDALAEVGNILGDRKLDFLFIDGDHSYEGVKLDYQMYSPFVRRGGVVAFHDIVEREDAPKIEVYRLWSELKSTGEQCIDFVASNGDRKIGIGALVKN